ncbi:hypothetical protein DSM112329_04273 [Paraconexibacter sp. AEG42_29]|uniref:SCP2 domain-containing protein n=1 Tax=Paraconexibacter sp. AEG42_29 TaxID=2997339 RepID=A0AAU7B085_9ACTN
MTELLPLLSTEWIAHYRELWNANTVAIEGTRGMGGLIELRATDIDDREPVQLNLLTDGTCDYAGPARDDGDPRFRLSATTETWRKLGAGEMGIRRAVTGPVKVQGSLTTALKFFQGLEEALRQFGDVPTVEWGGTIRDRTPA